MWVKTAGDAINSQSTKSSFVGKVAFSAAYVTAMSHLTSPLLFGIL